MVDANEILRLMCCFRGSFINEHGEFIAHRYSNTYFRLDNCESEMDIKCKVLEWLSRAASKGEPYATDKKNLAFHGFMQEGINRYLGTEFDAGNFDEIYTYLGNACNHAKTLRFIESGYDVRMLAKKDGG